MPPKQKGPQVKVETLTHGEATRKNIPTAEYQPVMQDSDRDPVPVIYTRAPAEGGDGLAEEKKRRNRDLDPQLVWRGKDEQDWSDLVVHAPPLYIQEKVHPKVLIDDLMKGVARGECLGPSGGKLGGSAIPEQLDLFADFNGIPSGVDKTEFYRHDQSWSNRMILGDSLQVMASLAEREGLRGKVQCIYIDPPYGIRFNSNFQWSTTSRDVKDGNSVHITREPEQVKAFRDTWRDGIHSYLTYLRDRLTVARDLLATSGSVFVQIGDENVHRIRALMDELYGDKNHISTVSIQKTGGQTGDLLASVSDFCIWYAKDIDVLKYRQLHYEKLPGEGHGSGARYSLSDNAGRHFRWTAMVSNRPPGSFPVFFQGKTWAPSGGFWKTGETGFGRLIRAERIGGGRKTLQYRRYLDDFPAYQISNIWTDVAGTADKVYVVQTASAVVQRCLLMATDPGDLVLDPTCGSGTTAYVAEQWGRRWITIDTSRVALALARARIMGARYPYYLLADSRDGQIKEAEVTRTEPSSQPTRGSIRHGFVYERVPHITLKSIANNAEIDVIWERWQETLEPLRESLNAARKGQWQEWEIPRAAEDPWPVEAQRAFQDLRAEQAKGEDARLRKIEDALLAINQRLKRDFTLETLPERPVDPWPEPVAKLHADWWRARIARQNEIDASIAAKAEVEYLYDKPYVDNKKVRVAGPFTVESLSPHRVLGVDEDDNLIDPLDRVAEPDAGGEKQSFPQMILENLKTAGVQQAHKEDRIVFSSLVPWPGDLICAEGRYVTTRPDAAQESGDTQSPDDSNSTLNNENRCAIFIGPEFGTVTRPDLVAAAREAADAGFDVLIACAFSYEAHATELNRVGRVPVLKARMNADLHMAEDLKATGKGNLFVIFGEPDLVVTSGQWLVTGGGRLVANYERVKELSGIGSLEAINRAGRVGLSAVGTLPAGRALRIDESGAPSGGVGGGEHRGWSGARRDPGVSPVLGDRERVVGRDGDVPDSSGAAQTGNAGRDSGGSGSSDIGRTDAQRAQALAALKNLKDRDFPLSLTTDHWSQVTIRGVDVFHPQTGEVRSDGPEGIACWFVDTDYNEESFFVRHAYFLGANDPYKALKTTLKAEIDEDAWASLHSDTSRPFPKPRSGRIAVKVINHLGDEVMKVFRVA